MADATTPIAGFDVEAVTTWIEANTDVLRGPFEWERLVGGHSNLTYALTDSNGTRAVVRRPPEGELLPKAHDMEREWRVLDALWDTPVPVAQPIALCTDTDVTGARFYVMGFVEGRPFYSADEVREWVPEERRGHLADEMVDALAALHAVDPMAVGLDRHGRPDGYVERQIRSWYGSWTASVPFAEIDDPGIHAAHDRLMARLPDQGPATLVHGDYMLHNVMFDRTGTVTAIVDWEISTLGDPLADLAYLLNGWVSDADVPAPTPGSPTLAEGFPERDHLTARYAERTGRDLSELDVYIAFNHFKTACILHGVYARYKNGQKAIDAADLEHLHGRVLRSIELASAAGAAL